MAVDMLICFQYILNIRYLTAKVIYNGRNFHYVKVFRKQILISFEIKI